MRFLLLAFALLAWSDARHHRHQQCFKPEEVTDRDLLMLFRIRAGRWARHTAVQLVPYLENDQVMRRRHRREQKNSCPNLMLQSSKSQETSDRSLSPWRYVINSDEDRHPRDLAFAECLCKGCIDSKTGYETTALYSEPVYQNIEVIHRKPCQRHDGTAGITFEKGYVNVPVGCTCVFPETSSRAH